MAQQCPGCNKFPSLETGDPEVNTLDIDENGVVTAEIRVVRTSACCGEEMKEYTFEVEVDPSDEMAQHIQAHEQAGQEYNLSVEEGSVEATEEVVTKDRHGKPIKNFRYMKTLIGFSATFQVTCDCGDLDETVEAKDSVPASSFDEIA